MSSWDDRLDREADRFDQHPGRTGFKWVAIIGGIIILIAAIGFIGRFACGWGTAVTNIARPENVSLQYREVIECYKSLEAMAQNACQVKNNPNTQSTLIEDPEFAYAAQYRQIAVDYDRRQNNFFEAEMVGPKGYPRNAPSLEEMQMKFCPEKVSDTP